MKIEQVKKLDVQERWLYWIKEREKIRLAKDAGDSKPWTDDVILQSYRFCNVRRMDDKVSQWLLNNWYKPYRGHPHMLKACCCPFLQQSRFFKICYVLHISKGVEFSTTCRTITDF